MKHQTSHLGRINIALSPNHIQDRVTPRVQPLLGHEVARDPRETNGSPGWDLLK